MRKVTKFVATSLVLAASASIPSFAPALAQDDGAPDVSTPSPMTDEQKMAYESWGVDQQAAYNTWPAEAQAYFWGLSESRQKMFFQLSASDQSTLLAMPDAEREAAWEMVEGRINDGMPGSERSGEAPADPAGPPAPPPPTGSEAPETPPPPPGG